MKQMREARLQPCRRKHTGFDDAPVRATVSEIEAAPHKSPAQAGLGRGTLWTCGPLMGAVSLPKQSINIRGENILIKFPVAITTNEGLNGLHEH
jgi:hypothetical protein